VFPELKLKAAVVPKTGTTQRTAVMSLANLPLRLVKRGYCRLSIIFYLGKEALIAAKKFAWVIAGGDCRR